MKKSTVFTLLALLLPILGLIALDGLMIVAGVAQEQRAAFRPIPGREGYLAMSPTYVQRYFQGFEPAVSFSPFQAERDENTFRVFAMGGSSAAGFPYQFSYAFPARLAARLEGAAPGQRIEVVNLGMTAVNSYTLWDLAKPVAQQKPDAVVIYAGHNEYYGAFGVGSSIYALGNRHLLKRLTLRLKRSPLFVLLERTLRSVRRSETAPETERTMMARVVRDATISHDSDVFRLGVEQFARNMTDLVAYFERADIPVYVATLTSNLADQPPLGDRQDAHRAFRRGDSLRALGDMENARNAFVEARELDDIRFRAPAAQNDVIRSLSRFNNVTIVDIEGALREYARPSIEGDSLFVDHLHPNALGYDLIARIFFDSLRTHPAYHVDAAIVEQLYEDPSGRLDPFEESHSGIQIARLKGGYPFDKTTTPEDEAQLFRDLLQTLRGSGRHADSLASLAILREITVPEGLLETARASLADGDTLGSLLAYRSLLHWQPFNLTLIQEAVGLGLESSQHMDLAVELAQFGATRLGQIDYLNAIAAIRLRQRRLEAARSVLSVVEARDPNSRVMLYNSARLHIFQGDTASARSYFERYRSLSQ